MLASRPSIAAAALLALASACVHVPTAKDREGAEVHHDLAVIAMQQGRAQEALKEFQEALSLNPDLAEAHNGLGLIYHWSFGRLADAKKEFEKALELKPNYPEAMNNLGVLFADMGEHKAAQALFEKALADPLYATPYIAQVNLGWSLHAQGRSPQGEQLIRAALQVRPDYCMGHRQLARVLEAGGRAEDATTSWEKFAKYCPEEPEALYHAGIIAEHKGRVADAAKAWRTCIEKGGDKPIAAECRLAFGRLPPMDEVPEEIQKANPTDAGHSVEGARDLETQKR